MSEERITRSVVWPMDLFERVKDVAERDRRSFSNMVTVLCEAALGQAEDAAPADAVSVRG